MSGFDHTAHAAQVAGNLAYFAGEDKASGESQGVPRLLKFGALEFPAFIEEAEPALGAAAPSFDKRGSDDVGVIVTVSRALFGAKLPKEGDSFTDAAGRNYRVKLAKGPPTSAVIRFHCGSVTFLP